MTFGRVLLGAALVLPLMAPALAASNGSAVTYKVQPGDSLWKIAKRHYGSPHAWSRIYAANRKVIGPSTRVLYPGMVLLLPAEPQVAAKALPPAPKVPTLTERPAPAPVPVLEANDVPARPSETPLEPVLTIEAEAPAVLEDTPVDQDPSVVTLASKGRLSPYVPAAASLIVPGTGQFIQGEWSRGVSHLGLTAFSVGSFQVGSQSSDPGLRWAGGLALVGISLWSAWDAYRHAEAAETP